MRLPTRVHGMLDYLLAALLMGAPWLFGFAAGGAETWVPVALGAFVLLYSLFTDYELGVVKRLQMPAHLLLDAVGGLLLAVSPWMLGFDEVVWIPHVALGLVEVVTAAITNTVPGYERRRAGR
ncbi:MAG TPA: hypothetical protein VGX50_07385 [Longimicrobium sp.]|nr:hypothetical protein [Longimicrobium sp.]